MAKTNGKNARGGAKPKQESLPGEGFERKTIAEIETAADTYDEAKRERMGLSKTESERKTALIGAMRKHNVSTYRMEDGRLVTLIPGKDKVKVGSGDEDDEGGEE